MKNKSTRTGATFCSSMRPRSATTSWLNKFKLLALVLTTMLSVNVWGADVVLTENFSSSNASSNKYDCTSSLGTASNRADFDYTWSFSGNGTVFKSGVKLGSSNNSGGTLTSNDILSDIPAGTSFTVKIYAAVYNTDGGQLTVTYNETSSSLDAANSAITATTGEYSSSDFTKATSCNFTKANNVNELTIASASSKKKRMYIDKVEVVYSAGPSTYTVNSTLTHVTASPAIPGTIEAGGTISATISASSGYSLPDDITVTGGTPSWNKTTGALSITNVTGPVSITIEAVANANYYISGDEGLTGKNWWWEYDGAKFINNKVTFTNIAAGNYQFKVSNGSSLIGGHSHFDNATGTASKTSSSGWDNAQVTLSCASDITFTLLDNQHVTALGVPTTCYVAGNGSGNWCGGKNWDAAGSVMTKNNGVHSVKFTNVAAGDYQFKVTNGTWNVTYGYSSADAGCSNTTLSDVDGNVKFTTTKVGDITITFDGTKICVTVEPYNTVQFSNNGQASATGMPANQYVPTGGKVSEPSAPSLSGYGFGGWYKEAACTNAWNFSTDVVSTNTTLYAKWIPTLSVASVADVVITATPQGGSDIAEGSSADVDYNKTVTLNYSSLTAGKGLTWKVYKTGDPTTTISVSSSGDGATFTMPAYPVTVDATIADLPTWTITLNTGSGTLASGTTEIVVVQGESTTLPSCEIECEDTYGEWEFAGWKTGSGVETITTTAQTFVEKNYTPSDDITLYAVYKAVKAGGVGEKTSETFNIGTTGSHYTEGNVTWSPSQLNYATSNYGFKNDASLGMAIPADKLPSKITLTTLSNGDAWASGVTLTIKAGDATVGTMTTFGSSSGSKAFDISAYSTTKSFSIVRSGGAAGKIAYVRTVVFEYASEGTITNYWSIPCNEKYTMRFHGVGGDASTIVWGILDPDNYVELNATTITAYPTCTTAETGWTFLGWRTSDYNSGKTLDEESGSTENPGVNSIYNDGKGYALNSGTTSPCGDGVRCVDMYPVFTKFVENDKPEIATLASGSKYYMYYTSDAGGYQDDYSSLDGRTTRIYAHTFSSASFSSTTTCASAQLFEFTKRADGNWDIRMRNAADDGYESHSYIYTVADNTDLYSQATQPDYGWVIETITINTKTMVKMQYAGNTKPQRFMKVWDGGGTTASGTFKNYSEDCEHSTQYHAIYLGSCSNRIFSSNPGHAATWEVYGDFTDDETENFVGYPMTNGMLVVPNLAANTTYQFKLRKTTDDGANYTWFGDKNKSNTYTTSGVEWTLDGESGGHNVNLRTGAAGSYTFTASHMSAEHPGITVTYPTAYTITYAGGDGASGSMSPTINIAAGENVALPTPTFTKTDWNCIGWTADVDVTVNSATVTAGSFIPKTATIQNINSNITLTAVWEQLVITQADRLYEVVVGGTLQLTLTANYSPNITTGATYTWATNNTNFATVDEDGLVTGHQAASSGEYVVVTSSFGTESNHYTIVVKSAACEQWGLHYWNTSTSTFGDLCFENVGGDEWRTDQEHLFALPSNSDAEKVKVLYHGEGRDKSKEWVTRHVPLIGSQKGNCGGTAPYAEADAIGYFRIYTGSTFDNYFLGFQPIYAMTYGVEGQSGWQWWDFTNTGSSVHNEEEYATEIVQIPNDYASFDTYVGAKRAESNPGVNYITGRSNRVKFNTVTNLTSGNFAGKFGKFYMYADWCDAQNFGLFFERYYRLHYDLDGGETAAAYDNQFAWSGASASDRTFALAATPTKEGYTFRGWSVSIGGGAATTQQPGTDVILTDDAVATAIWAQNYTVTYDRGECMGPITHYCSETVTVCAAPEAVTGYTFGGWKTQNKINDDHLANTILQPDETFVMPCDRVVNVIFNAKLTAISYNIIYKDQNDADFSGRHESGYPKTHTYDSETTLKSATKTGYEFGGWYKDDACEGAVVTTLGATEYTAEITLYAKWTANSYHATLNANGGTGTGGFDFTFSQTNVDNFTSNIARAGYDLNGFWSAASGGNQILNNDGTRTTNYHNDWITADKGWVKANNDGVLYAHWTAKSGIPYRIEYYLMDLTGNYPATATEVDNHTGTAGQSASHTQKDYAGFDKPAKQAATIEGDGSTVIKYYYVRHQHAFAWEFNGGVTSGEYTPANLNMYYGAQITYPTAITKEGYAFLSWSSTDETMPDADLTIIAQWGAYENYRTYCGNAVTFVANGGTGEDYVVTVDADKLTNIPTVETAGFTREGYGFAGWMVNGDESKKVYAPGETINPITDGMIVNAVWISNPTINEAVPAITSTNNVGIASAQRTLTVNNPDGLEATIHIAYKKNGEAVVATSSEFRFCNTSGRISEDNITSSETAIATDFTIQYKPNAYNKIDSDYTLYITVTRKGSSAIVSSAEFNLKGRSLPEKFVIAVQNSSEQWLALPANMTAAGTYDGMPITVTGEGLGMTADASLAAAYSLTGKTFVKDSVFFTSAYNGGNLWAAKSTSEINDNTATISSSNKDNFDWGLTPKDETLISYNMTNKNNSKDLRYWENSSKFGMYASGINTIYFIAVTPREETTAVVDEWYKNKILFHLPFAMKSVSMTINGVAVPDADITIAERKIKTTGYVLYELGGNIDLVAHSGQVMELIIDNGTTECVANISIPQIIVGEVDGCSALPAKADVVVRDGGHLTIDITDEGVAPKSFNNVTIYPNSKISVPDGKYFNVKSLTFFGGIDEMNGEETNIYAPELSLKGTMKADTLIYRMRVNATHMMPVSFPYDVTISKIVREDKLDNASWGKVGTDIRLETYNGELRAAGNRRYSDESTWTEIKEGTLTAGIGYAVAAQNRFKNYPYTILDFPMANPYKSAAVTEAVKNAAVQAHDAVNWYDKGWNLMGNPYLASITGTGAIKVNGTEYDFVYIPTADGEDYYQGPLVSAHILPFMDFFVQVNENGTMYFDLTKRVDAPARMLADIERTAQFSISLAGADKTDITYFKVADNFTESYDIPGDNAKMFGSAVNTKVYSLLNGEDQLAQMALNADMTAQPIQLGYIAPENGEYTFALDNTYTDYQNVEHIYLLENGEIKGDLLNAQYTFTTEAKTDDERFAILIVMKGAKMPTDLMDGLFNNDVASPKKVIYNDHFYILNTNRRVYDGTGKYINKMQENR